ncbi:MAG: NAD(P)/FAD-dependent oxidoreductase [Alphaproteobacteria bacterium]|nr:NAD(P)/FAD-dependent oxidoreductase [Alphaproteobacteria bacterium]
MEFDHDAIVIGAGVCGIYQAYRLQQMGVRFLVLEQASDVGGTWYWNRYPGCRFDSESETYGYSFSEELLKEWDWSEHFAPREETERYLQFVVDKFDLRQHMRFDSRLKSAYWDDKLGGWRIATHDGQSYATRFLLTAIGLLSSPTLPRYEGVESFEGLSFHTYHAPRDPVDFAGKRVAVVGTGATGVQLISEIADKVGSLTVFQRRPNWCAPLNNSPITSQEMQEIKQRYDEIFALCRNTPSGFYHDIDPRRTLEVAPEDREVFWEALYSGSGFGVWLGNFKDMLTDPAANAEFSKFVARKIRQRIDDPKIAEKLIPKDHGFGTRRVPMETNYYEVFNQDNVLLVDIGETPIERITRTGIKTNVEDFPFDIIIYATGFDAVTGAFDKIDIVGENGLRLKDKWEDGPQTAFGLSVHGFPNLLTLAGPQSGSVATNFPRGIEEAVNWCSEFLAYLIENKIPYFQATRASEEFWGRHVQEMSERILFGKEQSWFTGYNSNVDRKYRNRCLIYAGGQLRFRGFLQEERDNGYPSFVLSPSDRDQQKTQTVVDILPS